MPYSRRRYRRGAPRARKSAHQRQKNMIETDKKESTVQYISRLAGPVGKLAKAVLPVVTAINTESKYIDITDTQNLLNNSHITDLTAIAQGLTDQTRVGNSIKLQNVQIRFRVSQKVDNTLAVPVIGNYLRAMLLVWKGDAAIQAPTTALLLQDNADFFSCSDKNHSDQFVILKDWMIPVNAPAVISKADCTTQYYSGFVFKKFYKNLDFHCRYEGPLSTDYGTNHLYLFLAVPGGSNLTVQYYSRVNFTDN